MVLSEAKRIEIVLLPKTMVHIIFKMTYNSEYPVQDQLKGSTLIIRA